MKLANWKLVGKYPGLWRSEADARHRPLGYPSGPGRAEVRDLVPQVCEASAIHYVLLAPSFAINVPGEATVRVERESRSQVPTGQRDRQRCLQSILIVNLFT